MSTRHLNDRAARASGFTLIELMVAMVLGLIVIAGVTSVFLAGQQSFRTNDALANVQDSSRVAFELMARDIREAGLAGCNSVNDRVTNVYTDAPGNGGKDVWWADWSNMVHGYDDASGDPALAGIASGVPVAGTNSLELVSAAGTPVEINTDNLGSDFTLNAATTNLTNGDLALVCSPQQAAILQIGYAAGGTDVTYKVGNGVAPGNCSTNLGYQNNACTGDSPDYTFPGNSVISRMSAVDWYIGTNDEGGTSLYRVSLVNKGGTPTPQTQEMVRNVTAMTITYLNPTIAALGNKFVDAATISANGGWLGVTAINVALTVQSTFQRASVTSNAPLQRSYSFTTTVRNRVN